MKKSRIDDRLVQLGLCADRDEALRMVIAGEVLADDIRVGSVAQLVSKDTLVRVKSRKRFVSRGGDKLAFALDAFNVDVSSLRCLDIGSSTGGFTDCLLQAGAAEVTCVDVNYGQLAWSIRSNPYVRVFERTNIRKVDPDEIGAPFDIIVIDVSFIGLAVLAPSLASLSSEGTRLLALVKPQFESAHDETDHGVVRDEAVRMRTVDEVSQALAEVGFKVQGAVESPVKGPAGNIEYLINAVFRK